MNRGARATADTFLHLMAPDGWHETTDPEVVIVEYEAHGTVGRTGATFDQRVIAVLRIRHGQVLTYRDYINPQPLIEALTSGGEGHA